MSTRAGVLEAYEAACEAYQAAKTEDEKWEALHEIRKVANRAYACDKQAPQEPEPEPTNLRELTVKQLREMAKSNGIPGSSRMSKSQIIKALAES